MYVSDARHCVASITPGGRPRIVARRGVAGSAILPAVPGRALLPVTWADVAGIAGAGLLAVLLGVCLVAIAAVARRGMERDGTRL
ncbi:hypothetical protein [Dactylosporangium sp. NPDC049140]|uniref:hypothetical protein n=1 Tax=Dactylosporangium sp. NPDC049140 TaxID=3155647 RepID=UPI0033DA91A7